MMTATINRTKPQKRHHGQQCTCGGKIASVWRCGSKHTQHCTLCGQHTFGHDRLSEAGPAEPEMHKPTNKRRLNEIYGNSYFGSGGGWGGVDCCDNCEVSDYRDNGFVDGASEIRVIDWRLPARFAASGGDSINGGRHWQDSGEWNPMTRRWELLTAPVSR